MTEHYLLKLSGEHIQLALDECEQVLEQKATTLDQQVVQITTNKTCEQLAFTKSAHNILLESNIHKWEEELKKLPSKTTTSIRIEIEDKEKKIPKNHLLRSIMEWMGKPRVDLEHAESTIRVFVLHNKVYITTDTWTNTQEFSKRKNQYLPQPHPTSLHPKLARGLINLSGAHTELLDPFCGSGGILLEAGLLGLHVKGCDIDPIMVRRAQLNLAAFKLEAELTEENALNYSSQSEVIVTDLPYGKNSKAGDLNTLYKSFLDHATTLTKTMVVMFPSLVDHKKLIQQSRWNTKQYYEWPLHRTLSKHIYVVHISAI